jgi:peptidoglycan/xylan/chitin deacetylase (PgdA/CDA1 family)
MRYLKQRGLRGVSMRELYRAVSAGNVRAMVGLTFDDGYKDFLHTALPILEGFGFTATVFVIGGLLGEENSWEHYYEPKPRLELLEAEEVREVSERGMEVGAHSMSHAWLSGLNPERLEEEVSGSRQVLGELLGEAVEGFCYPYGILYCAAIEAVRRAGYAYACAVDTRVEKSVYDVPRIPVAEVDHSLRLAVKFRVYPQYSWVARRLRLGRHRRRLSSS